MDILDVLERKKNHHKLLNVFLSYKNKNPKCKLILCGDGEKRPEIEQQIHALELDNDVILMGMIDNVNEILQGLWIYLSCHLCLRDFHLLYLKRKLLV